MLHLDFLRVLSENIGLYFMCLLLCSVIFFFIGRRLTASWIDPLRIIVFFSVFADAIPFFLYFVKLIPLDLLTYFIVSESLMWIGILIFSVKKISFARVKIVNEKRVALKIYFSFFFLYLCLIVFTYIRLGIPLFMESRLSLFVDTGLGTIERLMPLLQLYCLIFSFYLLDETSDRFSRISIFVYFVFFVFALTGILSGSKSALLPFLYAYFGYTYFYKGISAFNKRHLKYIVYAVIAGVMVVAFSQQVSGLEAIEVFLFRFIGAGDVYWMGYVNDVYASVDIHSSWEYLFSGILAPLRLIPIPEMSSGIGFQMVGIINPYMEDVLMGPNVRPAMLGLILFRQWGVLLPFFIGVFLSLSIYRIPRILPQGIISCIYFTYIYITVIVFIVDPALAMGLLTNIIFCSIFLFGVLILFTIPNKSKS